MKQTPHGLSSPEAAYGPSLNRKAGERPSMKNPERLGCFAEVARVLVRFDQSCQLRRKHESRHHVTGCETLRSQLRC